MGKLELLGLAGQSFGSTMLQQHPPLPRRAQVVGDYRKVDGILLPHRIVDKLESTQMIMVLTGIEHNMELPASQFNVPVEVVKKREIQ